MVVKFLVHQHFRMPRYTCEFSVAFLSIHQKATLKIFDVETPEKNYADLGHVANTPLSTQMTFDARTAKGLLPGQHLTIDEQPGLRLVASQSKRSWVYRYKSRLDGAMRQIKIGEWPHMSYHAAVSKWEILRAARERGEDPALQRQETRRVVAKPGSYQQSTVLTVRQLCDDYLKGHIKHRAPKGRAEVERMFRTMLGEIQNCPAHTITRKIAFDTIKGFDGSPVIASNLRRELGAAWDYALDSGVLSQDTPNWWRLILRGKLKSKGPAKLGIKSGVKKRVLTPDEVGILIRWLPNFSKNVSDVLTVYLWTGVRGAEIEQMQEHEITKDSSGLWWTIPKAKTKNRNRPDAVDQRVALHGRAAEVVQRRKELFAKGYLFPAQSKLGYFAQKNVGVAVYHHMPHCKTKPHVERPRLPVTDWAPHDLRRTVRTFLAAMGCPSDIAELILGHMLKGEMGIYNRYQYDNEKSQWLLKLSDYLEQLAAR